MVKRLIKLILIVFAFNIAFGYGTRFAIGSILKIFFNIFGLHNPRIIIMISSLIYNYAAAFLFLFIVLYLLKKFDYMRHISISLKAFFKLIIFTMLVVVLTKYSLDRFNIYNFSIWIGLKHSSFYWTSWVDYLVASLQIFAFTFVALTEEYFYRVIVYHKISEIITLKNRGFEIITAILLTNILFSLGHYPIRNYNIWQLLSVFIWGLFFSYLYLRTKNIYTACTMHFILDARVIITLPFKNFPLFFSSADPFYIIISILLIEIYKAYKRFYVKPDSYEIKSI